MVATGNVLAIAVIPIIVVSVILGLYLNSIPSSKDKSRSTSTSNLTTGSSITTTDYFSSTNGTPNSSSLVNGSLSLVQSQVSRYVYNRSWEFSVFAFFDQNNRLDLNSTLTYLSPQAGAFAVTPQFNTLQVIYQNGTRVWNDTYHGLPGSYTMKQGENFTDLYWIPTSVLQVRGTYAIIDFPLLSFQNGTSMGQQLEVNMTLKSPGPTTEMTATTAYSVYCCGGTTSIVQSTTTTYRPIQSWIYLDSSNGSAACEAIVEGAIGWASWSGNTCTLSGLNGIGPAKVVGLYTGLVIFPGVTLLLSNVSPGFQNGGTIINNGTIIMQSGIANDGVINNYGLISNATGGNEFDNFYMADGGTINNYGTFKIPLLLEKFTPPTPYPNGTMPSPNTMTVNLDNQTYVVVPTFYNAGVFNNYGILNNTGAFQNFMYGSTYNSTFNNYGTLENGPDAFFQNNYTVTNNGSIINAGSFTNHGIVVNLCGGNFEEWDGGNYVGNAIIGVCGTTTTTVQVTIMEKNSSPG